ncbi:MAG TPA: class I SAM-dependent methyltransferase [Verrucomicrobiae bacterium]|nr:class I SAM-dependent methyltransferase [Verrucomicrobiae bacterium]
MEFSELQEIIRSEVASQAHLASIRRYNHAMIDDLNNVCPLADRTMLDVGASVHAYALEAALTKGVRRYEGVDLGIERHWKTPRVEFVGDAGNVGRLTRMNAGRLEFADEAFDCILTISTFEHFLDPAGVLVEMHRVLRPGGVALVTFEPVWTASYGHHLHHLGAIGKRVPDWGHLYLTETQMRAALATQPWPDDGPLDVEQAIRWIYHGGEINRFDIRRLKEVFRCSPLEIVWMCDLPDEDTGHKRTIAEYLTRLVPFSTDELMTKGLSLLLRKGPGPSPGVAGST